MLARGLVALVAATAVATETATCELHDQNCVLAALTAEKPEALELLQVARKKPAKSVSADTKSLTAGEGDVSILKDSQDKNPEENSIDSSETESMISGDEKTESSETQTTPTQSDGAKAVPKHGATELPTASLLDSNKPNQSEDLLEIGAPNFEKKLNDEAAKHIPEAKTAKTAKTAKIAKKIKTSLLESKRKEVEDDDLSTTPDMESAVSSENDESGKASSMPSSSSLLETAKDQYEEEINSPETDTMISNEETEGDTASATDTATSTEKTSTGEKTSTETASDLPTSSSTAGKTAGQTR